MEGAGELRQFEAGQSILHQATSGKEECLSIFSLYSTSIEEALKFEEEDQIPKFSIQIRV